MSFTNKCPYRITINFGVFYLKHHSRLNFYIKRNLKSSNFLVQFQWPIQWDNRHIYRITLYCQLHVRTTLVLCISLVWTHVVPPCCIHANKIMSHAILNHLLNIVAIDSQPFWNFETKKCASTHMPSLLVVKMYICII